jgi:DNA-binding LacI/PurR family transcriptional regulator
VTTESLVFHAAREPRHGDFAGEVAAARETAQRLLTNSQITAVVAANDRAAWGLFDVLRASDILPQRWPAVVGFDNSPSVRGHVISSMRLPLEELGREAADLLCDRRQGILSGKPQHREVAMRLIPRLTSRPDWSHVAAHVALAAAMPG